MKSVTSERYRRILRKVVGVHTMYVSYLLNVRVSYIKHYLTGGSTNVSIMYMQMSMATMIAIQRTFAAKQDNAYILNLG